MGTRYSIAYAQRDVFRIVVGSGWVILENGKRVDWPLLPSRDEAESDLIDFERSSRQLASDEASERFGLSRMGA